MVRMLLFLAASVACNKPPPPPPPSPTVVDAATVPSTPLVVSASPSPPTVSPMRVLVAADVPKDIVVPGTVAKAIAWTDANGENVVVFAIQWVGTIEDHDPLKNVYLTIEHVAYPRDGARRILRIVKDSKDSCDDAAMKASFLDAALSVTDLDSDGIGEVTFAYRITCQGHREAFTQKLLVLENGDKYILRGTSLKTYEVDPSFGKAPPSFLEHAKARWPAQP